MYFNGAVATGSATSVSTRPAAFVFFRCFGSRDGFGAGRMSPELLWASSFELGWVWPLSSTMIPLLGTRRLGRLSSVSGLLIGLSLRDGRFL